MMRSRFLQGLLWGGVVGTVLGAIIGPRAKIQKKPVTKPLAERGAEAVMVTTQGLMREARRARKRLMKKID